MLGLGHFVDDYLLDFDIYHVSHVTELLLYIDTKYLSEELGRSQGHVSPLLTSLLFYSGGTNRQDYDTWMFVQYSLDSFTDKCTKLARRLTTFIKVIKQEDISLLDNYDCMREVAHKNRAYYRELRTELHHLSTDGLHLQHRLASDGANGMQKLSGKY